MTLHDLIILACGLIPMTFIADYWKRRACTFEKRINEAMSLVDQKRLESALEGRISWNDYRWVGMTLNDIRRELNKDCEQ